VDHPRTHRAGRGCSGIDRRRATHRGGSAITRTADTDIRSPEWDGVAFAEGHTVTIPAESGIYLYADGCYFVRRGGSITVEVAVAHDPAAHSFDANFGFTPASDADPSAPS
jgi:hypothetical protein